ncbi:MAG: EF-hand domain-containing protein [Gemmobacter sp.]
MKRNILTAFAALLSVPAIAVAASIAVEDRNGDGVYSFEELQAAVPDLTVEQFDRIDRNGDGVVSPEELEAAAAEGLIAQ